jgi:two-component system cell cycle response regulator
MWSGLGGPSAELVPERRAVARETVMDDAPLPSPGAAEASYHEELWRLATIDDLTQVFNRRYFDDAIERELSRARRESQPLCLALVTPDRLHAHRTAHGQRLHDLVLEQLAELLHERSREDDTVARYRDDTFAVLLPGLALAEASQWSEGAREAIERHRLALDGHDVDVTVSIGVVELLAELGSADALVDAADARLRQADAAGGNRVASTDEATHERPEPPAEA